MLDFIKKVVKSNKEVMIFAFIFLPSFIVCVETSFLFPILTSIILSYFLYKIQKVFLFLGMTVSTSFALVYSLFLALFLFLFFMFGPIVFKQLVIFFNDLPFIIQKIKIITYRLMKEYPIIFPKEQTNLLFSNVIFYVQSIGKTVISASLLSIVILTKWLVYLFFIPILMFFFLKDYLKIMNTFRIVMPEKSEFWKNIWFNTYIQINNYIRGKIIEVIIVSIANYILFKFYKLAYAGLLGVIVGLSVVIPYVGTIVVSIPIMFIGAIQLGLSNKFFYLLLFYLVIQFLDGNLLVPVLFAEAVNLHPITIILSVVVLGFIFKIYGLFFAIPIAIVIKAIIKLYFFPNINDKKD